LPKAYGPSYVIEARGTDTVHIGISHLTDEQAARVIRLLPQIAPGCISHTEDTRARIEAIEQRAGQLNLLVTRPYGLRLDRNDPIPPRTVEVRRGDLINIMPDTPLSQPEHGRFVSPSTDAVARMVRDRLHAAVARALPDEVPVPADTARDFVERDGINYKITRREHGIGYDLAVKWLRGPSLPTEQMPTDLFRSDCVYRESEAAAHETILQVMKARRQQLNTLVLQWTRLSIGSYFAARDGIKYQIDLDPGLGGVSLKVRWLRGPPLPVTSAFNPNTAGAEWFVSRESAMKAADAVARARFEQLDAEAQRGE
jgi:hypothetical protein